MTTMSGALLALVICVNVVQGFITSECFSGGGTCMFTPPDVYCPTNYYCPFYQEYQLMDASIQKVLNASLCTYSTSNQDTTNSTTQYVICPCTPGFYCPERTELPTYCPEGYYCPSTYANSTDADGAGSWGGVYYECPEKKFCPTGTIDPFECGSLSKCPSGTVKADKTGYWVVVIFLIIIFYILFKISDYISSREKKTQNQEVSREISYSENIAESNAVVNPSHNNLMSPIISQDVNTIGSTKIDSFLIEFNDLSLTLKSGTTVMSGVNGKFQPGRLCAIMGASGAGKTTVINLITGKVPRTSGTILVNGKALPTHSFTHLLITHSLAHLGKECDGLGQFQKLVGFVPQEDVMIRELSVRDNIEFSARYRLPRELTTEEINRKVNACINELGIPHVQHSPIGDERTRGVSGGQRKRVNIGIELVADPKVLFLDEPTSGLDSTTATSLCSTLKKIANIRQMTIAAVIHQPSLSSFLEFDDLLLLGKGGRVIYHGPVNESEAYFKSVGFQMPVQCNPADFYLDVTQGVIPRKDHPEFEWADLFDLWEEHCSSEGNQTRMSKSLNSERTSESVKKSQIEVKKALSQKPLTEQPEYVGKMAVSMVVEGYYAVYDFFVDQHNDIDAYIRSFYEKDPIRETPSGWYQFYLCYIRASKQCFGGFSSFMIECVLHLLCGAVIAVSAGRLSFVGPLPDATCLLTPAALQSDCTLPLEGNYPQTGNFMCFGVLFAAVATSAGIFGNEQVNFWRETSSGLQPVPYFFGKWIAYIPRIICSAFFFWFAFSIKFNNTGKPKDLFEIILFLYWFGYSIGFFVSQIVNIRDAALTGVLFALIFAVGFSGVNPDMNEVRDKGAKGGFWSLSGPRWAIEAFYIASIKNYKTVPNGPYDGAPYEDVTASLSAIGYNVNNFSYDIGGLFWTGLGWGLFALAIMVTFRKYRPS